MKIDPFLIVAAALGCDVTSLSIDSGWNSHPDWDSFGQLSVIVAIEAAYDISISDDDVAKLATMRDIVRFCAEKACDKP